MNVPPKGNAAFRLGAYFETLKVSQQPVPNLTVRIAEGAFWAGGTTLVEFSGGNTAVMVAPGAGLAVWVLVALTANGSVQLVYGVPAATNSPPAPAVPAGYIPLAFVYLTNGMTAVTNDMIFDERPLWVMQTSFVPLAGATMTGPLILNANPTAAMGAATKQYVDTQDALHPTFTDLNNGLLSKADIDGTPSDTFVLNSDWVGAPSTNVFFGVDRGSQPNTYLRWNEGTDLWELTNDGSTYSQIITASAIGAYLPLTGGTLTGPLLLASDPIANLQAATKQYVDATIAVDTTFFVLKAGDTMTGVLAHSVGSAALPSITFAGDLDTGFYHSAANEVSVAINGAQKVLFSSAGVTVFSGFFSPGTGGAGAPEHTFTNDPTTGLYRIGAGQMGVAAAGANVATFSATGLAVTGDIAATGGLSVSGPATMDLDMGGFKVVNMLAPVLGTDATNKTYVDTQVATKVSHSDTFALTGDVTVAPTALTGPANSFGATLANTAVSAASYGSASSVGTFTVDSKGRLTAAAAVSIAIAGAAVTVGGFISGHVVSLDASGHPVDSSVALANVFLASGAVAATGSFNLNSNNINNVVQINGNSASTMTVTAGTNGSGVGLGLIVRAGAGTGASNGGDLSLTSGSVSGSGSGGSVFINSGQSGSGNASGQVRITTEDGVATDGFAGAITIKVGASVGIASGLTLQLTGASSVDGTAGNIELDAGSASGTGSGGSVILTAGTGVGSPGTVRMDNAGTALTVFDTHVDVTKPLNVQGNGTTNSLQVTAANNVAIGLATDPIAANDGFPYIPFTTSSGAPSGTPTAITGFAPMIAQNDAGTYWLWVYIPAVGWKKASLA